MTSAANTTPASLLGSGYLQSLSRQPLWVLWRKETIKGRATKVPRTATGKHASVTDPTTWAPCDQLLPPPAGMDGVGIVLGGTLGGLDLDACIQDDGTLEPWAGEIVERLDTYCEVSPSGRGIKLLLRGCDMAGIESGHEVSWGEPVTMPDGTTKRRELALYPGSRFFTVTGNLWLDRPIRTVPEADLRWVLERIEQIRCDEKRSKAEQKQPFTTLPVPLPKQLQQLIQHGAPEGQRSGQFHHAVGWLRDLGYSQSGAINLLQQYPDGIAAKYSGRLPEEVARCWGKITSKDDATGGESQGQFVPRLAPVQADFTALRPIRWVLGGCLAAGEVVTFAGQPGVGKSTAFASLALVVAGFGDDLGSDIANDRPRDVVIVSENPSQYERILFGLCERHKLTSADVADRIHLHCTARLSVAEIDRELGHLLSQYRSDEPPLIILDTASATFELESENDNAQVGAALARLRPIFESSGAACWIVAHAAKALGREDSEITPRGASAWIGDVNGTGSVFREKAHPNSIFIRSLKNRHERDYEEIEIVTHVQTHEVVDDRGVVQEVRIRTGVPKRAALNHTQRLEQRKAQAQAHIEEDARSWMLDVIRRDDQIVTRRRLEEVAGSRFPRDTVRRLAKALVAAGDVRELPITPPPRSGPRHRLVLGGSAV